MGGGQPISRSMEAELWQGHPKEPEGWETTVYLTYAASAILLTLVGLAPDTSIKTVSDRLFLYTPPATALNLHVAIQEIKREN